MIEFKFINTENQNISVTIKAFNYHEAIEVLNVIVKNPTEFQTQP